MPQGISVFSLRTNGLSITKKAAPAIRIVRAQSELYISKGGYIYKYTERRVLKHENNLMRSLN